MNGCLEKNSVVFEMLLISLNWYLQVPEVWWHLCSPSTLQLVPGLLLKLSPFYLKLPNWGDIGMPSQMRLVHRFAFLCATLSDLGFSVYTFFFPIMLKTSGLWRFSSIPPRNHLVLMSSMGFPLITFSLSFKELGKYKLSICWGQFY